MNEKLVFIKSSYRDEIYCELLMLGDSAIIYPPRFTDFVYEYRKYLIEFEDFYLLDLDLYSFKDINLFIQAIEHFRLLDRGGYFDYCAVKISDLSGQFLGYINGKYSIYQFKDLLSEQSKDLISKYKRQFEII